VSVRCIFKERIPYPNAKSNRAGQTSVRCSLALGHITLRIAGFFFSSWFYVAFLCVCLSSIFWVMGQMEGGNDCGTTRYYNYKAWGFVCGKGSSSFYCSFHSLENRLSFYNIRDMNGWYGLWAGWLDGRLGLFLYLLSIHFCASQPLSHAIAPSCSLPVPSVIAQIPLNGASSVIFSRRGTRLASPAACCLLGHEMNPEAGMYGSVRVSDINHLR